MIGERIGGYVLEHQLGAGGMGAVWLASHVALGRRAAIKLLHPQMSAQPEMVARFFNEARAATAISDPGIVQVYDFGTDATGRAYIVMELLHGESLHARLTRIPRLPLRDALRIVRQVASTLGAAHAHGIVHRDIKPENIFLCPDGEVVGGERAKVLDFGIAKLAPAHGSGVQTQTHAMLGTPMYMSPEQCRGASEADARADVYALGCVLFDALTGRTPFVGTGAGELIAAHMFTPAPLLGTLVQVPAPIEALVARCLAKSPHERPADGAALAAEIAAVAAALPASTGNTTLLAVPTAAERGAVTGAPTTLSSMAMSTQRDPPRRRRSRAPAVAGVAALVAVAGGIAVYLARVPDPPAAPVAAVEVVDAPSANAAPDAAVAATAPVDPPPEPPLATVAPDAPPPPSDREQVAPALRAGLDAFVAWGAGHAGKPCPRVLTPAVPDPWGTPVIVTCTDQPANQVAGSLSAGPDRMFGTDDDFASWMFGAEVTAGVRGARWQVKTRPYRRPGKRPPGTTIVDDDGDSIPDKR